MTKTDETILYSSERKMPVKLIYGGSPIILKKRIVGRCSGLIHPGYLTDTLMKGHQCIERNCPHFVKLEEFPYWKNRQREKESSLIAKEHQRQRKENRRVHELEEQAALDNIKKCAINISDHMDLPIIITRVMKLKSGDVRKRQYVVNYVSPDRYNDWHDYMELATALHQLFLSSFILRHVTYPDGEYVTSQEWLKIRKMR